MRLPEYAPRPACLKWLLDSDPAIRWQVMRDLTGETPAAIAAARSRVATEGWGARLLALQSPAGNWGGPKEDPGLLVTLYTLVLLKDLGLDPAAKQARKMISRVDKRLVFKPLNNRPFLHGETEPCINGRILGIRARDGRVLVPPQEYDPQTGDALNEFVEVSEAGVVTTWTWVYEPRPMHLLPRPFAFALVKLDGADTAMLHIGTMLNWSLQRTASPSAELARYV